MAAMTGHHETETIAVLHEAAEHLDGEPDVAAVVTRVAEELERGDTPDAAARMTIRALS